MKILLAANSSDPSVSRNKPSPSGSGQYVHDLLARALGELGHEVSYLIYEDLDEPLADTVRQVRRPPANVDLFHTVAYRDEETAAALLGRGVPWLNTCQLDLRVRGWRRPPVSPNWVYVSKTMARSFDSDRYVHNGLDPESFIYSETKENYLLFIANLEFAREKGLETALTVARQSGIPLIVAGTARSAAVVAKIEALCRDEGARSVGYVRGRRKAELLAGARALLFPSQLAEACPLVIAEAMFSGTPILASDRGACPELIAPGTGFVCSTEEDYRAAMERLDEIRPADCRAYAMKTFHYHRMASDYLNQYEWELEYPFFPEPPKPYWQWRKQHEDPPETPLRMPTGGPLA